MEKGHRIGSPEFVVLVVIILLVAFAFWFLFFQSIQNKTAIGVYQSVMKSVQSGAAICVSSGGILKSGWPGDALCEGEYGMFYSPIISQCGPRPYYSVNYEKEKNEKRWEIEILESPGGKKWDCQGCEIVCGESGCAESQKCN